MGLSLHMNHNLERLSDGGISFFPPLLSQLCNGGSVTELIKGLLIRGCRLQEPVISYILYSALLVRRPRREILHAKKTKKKPAAANGFAVDLFPHFTPQPPRRLLSPTAVGVLARSLYFHHMLTRANDRCIIAWRCDSRCAPCHPPPHPPPCLPT